MAMITVSLLKNVKILAKDYIYTVCTRLHSLHINLNLNPREKRQIMYFKMADQDSKKKNQQVSHYLEEAFIYINLHKASKKPLG